MIAFFLYFSQWMVVDRHISDFWFNITLTTSSLLFLLVGPVLGSIADQTGNRTTGIRVTTVLTALFYFFAGVVTVSFPDREILAIAFFISGSTTYLLSFIYYNSFLRDLAPQDKHGIVSGWGLFGNFLGEISAILIALPFATGAITLWGNPGRAQAFIPASVIFLLLSLPLLITFKRNRVAERPLTTKISEEYKNTWKAFVNLCRIPSLGRFFLAYFFFNDAVLTAGNNFPIYMEKVFGTDDTVKSYILLGILITSALGCLISGWIGDKIGLKKTLIGILLGWIVILPLMAVANNLIFLIIVTTLMGLWFGGAWTVTRAIILQYTPNHSLNQAYTYFTLMERFATFIGPVSWGLIVAYGPHLNALNYRIAAFSMAIFVIIGLLIANKLPNKKDFA